MENFIFCADVLLFADLLLSKLTKTNPTSNYMFKVNNRNIRTRIEICSNLICSSVFIASIEQVNADWK